MLPGQVVLNKPEAIAAAKNKLHAFRKFTDAGVPVPDYWTDKAQVDRKGIIIARQSLAGSGGEGIVVIRPEDKMVDAPLYTRYIKKEAEYRLHVAGGKVLAVQQKRRDSDAEQTPDQKLIRNHANGWVFAINNVTFANDEQRKACETIAVASVAALDLDFGAVDLVVSKKDNRPYVLEVNTAPGIESPTILEQYTNTFRTIDQGTRYVVPQQARKEVARPRVAGNRNLRRGSGSGQGSVGSVGQGVQNARAGGTKRQENPALRNGGSARPAAPAGWQQRRGP